MEKLRQHFEPVSTSELICRTREGGSGLCAVTFDDGYRDCYEHAFPILQEMGIPFTLFVTTGFIECGTWTFSRRFAGLPALSWDQILTIQAGGAEIGCHSHQHQRFSNLAANSLRSDLTQSKAILEDRTGRPVRMLAYPYGQPDDYDARSIQLIKELGFQMAFTTLHTTFRSWPDLLQFPRISINGEDDMRDFQQQLKGKRDILAVAQTLRSKARLIGCSLSGRTCSHRLNSEAGERIAR
jgi:peptidoglycan/xylan/chitin deacetylase (PgdA/CDA1 family)